MDQSQDVVNQVFSNAQTGLQGIIGDLLTTVGAIISILLLVYGAKFLVEILWLRDFLRNKDDREASIWLVKMKSEDPVMRDVAKIRYRRAIKRLADDDY